MFLQTWENAHHPFAEKSEETGGFNNFNQEEKV